MEYKLDIIDKKIVSEIDANCRRHLSIIAKKLKISQQRLQYRLRKLEKNNIITLYHTLVDTSLLGYTFYRVMIRFQNITPKKEEEIIEYLVQNPLIFWIGTCAGRWDLMVDFFAKTIIQFDQTIQNFMENYSDFISQKSISTIISSKQYTKSYLIQDSPQIEFKKSYGGTPREIQLDKKDREILKIINNDPTIKNIEIGKILKIDRNTAKNRINRMIKKKIITGFRGWFNTAMVGYHSFKLIIRSDQRKKDIESKLITFARINRNIIYLNKMLGDWDYEYDIETQKEDQFYELLTKIKNTFSANIRDYEILKINQDYKFNYVPPI